MNNTAKQLKEKILRVFVKTEPPKAKDITRHYCEEGNDLKRDFLDVKWWCVKKEIIDRNHGNLPLFTNEAYHYYFPAFLINALEALTEHNEVLQFLIYDLSPEKDGMEFRVNSYLRKRSQLFTLEESKIILDFLEIAVTNEKLNEDIDDVNRALNFWNSLKH